MIKLENGMHVELRNGYEYIVVKGYLDMDGFSNHLVDFVGNEGMRFDDYDDDGRFKGDDEWDIIKVSYRHRNSGRLQLVWEREVIQEMTLSEVCKALGKEIKIVKEK